MTQQSREKFVYLPLEVATTPPPGQVRHFKDHWWAVDPERGLLFYKMGRSRSPQCNTNQAITDRLKPHWAESRLIPSVFVRVNHEGEYLLPKETENNG